MTIITPVRSCLPLSGTINNRTSNYCTCPACPGSLLQQGHITLFITLHFRRCVSHLKSSKNFFIQVDRSCQEASEKDGHSRKIFKPSRVVEAGSLQEVPAQLRPVPARLPLQSGAAEEVSGGGVALRAGRVWKSSLHTWVSQKIRYDNNTITLMLTTFCHIFSWGS